MRNYQHVGQEVRLALFFWASERCDVVKARKLEKRCRRFIIWPQKEKAVRRLVISKQPATKTSLQIVR